MTKRVFGAPIKRREDPELLRGDARFTADLSFPGMLHMAVLRSPHGHALIRHIDTDAAARMPGVVRVVTFADLQGKLMPLPCIWIPGGVESHFPSHPFGFPGAGTVLAKDRVRFIGDPVAVVVAETRDQAFDAVKAIEVDYEPLPVVVSAEEAVKDGAPQLHEEVPHNLNAYWTCGNSEAADHAIAQSEVVIHQTIYNQRTINNPIEPRAAVGMFDAATGDYTLYASTQSPHNHRLLLSFLVLGIPFNKLRIVAPNIGGSFGTKGYLYPDMALTLYLSKELGRPVKWVDTRNGMMRSTVQGRDHMQYATLAGTRDGKITALRCTSYANLGAYPSTIGPGVATAMMGRSITGPYAIKNAFAEVYAAYTNTVPLGAQRGSGRAEATFMMERLIDRYAKEIGLDPLEVRRRNMIAPDEFPYDNGLGWLYDSGNYEAALDRAVQMAGLGDIAERKAAARQRGKRLGVGMASFVAISGVGPSPRMGKEGMLGGTWESANVKVHPSGEVTVIVGSKPHGQSHETVFAQIASEELGVDVSRIQVLHSDTLRAPYGQGSYGSRSLSVCGPAVQSASRKVKNKMIKAAAHMLEAAEEDIILEEGKFSVRGAPGKSKTFGDMALGVWYGWELPSGMEPNLDETTFFDPPDFNYPFGSHIAIVEIDETTGKVDLVRFVAVNDMGNVANSMVMDGQIHGGIAHGVGQALYERAIYDDQGHLLSDSFMDYTLPRPSHLPSFEIDRTVTPTPHNALGAKGGGEVGTVGAAAAVANAVVDALSDLGVKHIDMPLTPEKVWRVMRDAKAAQNAAAASKG